MTHEPLERLYKDVFDLVYPQVANDNTGVLYKVIHILLEGEESKADEICIDTHINKNASLNEDESIASEQLLMEKPNALNQLMKGRNWLTQKMQDITLNNLNNPDMATVAWLVFIGSLLIGLLYCKKFVNNRNQNSRSSPRKPQHLSPITAALCLVVPASAIVDLRDKHSNGLIDNSLNTSDIKILIDNASYFLCTTLEEANKKEAFLEIETTNEKIITNSSQEVYIKIIIKSGQEMIGKESPYILKRNLPDRGECIVKRYDCLKKLSGLENFNRI